MANFFERHGRRECLLWLGAWSLSGCVTSSMSGGQAVTVRQNAERIFAVMLAAGGPELETLEWSNRPPGERTPGPFPLPIQDRLQVGSGFPRDLAKPLLVFDRPSPTEGVLYEAYSIGFVWAVNEALKTTLDAIDPSAFDSLRGETRFPDGSSGPDYWLLDLVRFVDCYDVARSAAANPLFVSERGSVDFTADGHFFRSSALGEASFFRIPQSYEWLCTAAAKQRVESEGYQRVRFLEVGWAV